LTWNVQPTWGSLSLWLSNGVPSILMVPLLPGGADCALGALVATPAPITTSAAVAAAASPIARCFIIWPVLPRRPPCR
jgi:hypothetical protein